MTRSLAVGGLLAAALFVGTASPASAQFIAPGYGYGGGYTRVGVSYSTGFVTPNYGYGYGGYPGFGYGYSPAFAPRFSPGYGYGGYPGYGYGGYRGGYGSYGRGGYGGYPGYGYGRGGFSFGFSTFR